MTGLKPLSEYWSPPVVTRRLAVPFVAAAALFIASMRLVWHHRIVPGAGYTLVLGIDGASWLLIVAGIAIVVAFRLMLLPQGWWTRWALGIVCVMLLIDMFADYLDWKDRAAFFYVAAYFGPGFYVGLAGTACFIAGTVLVWLKRE